MTTLSDIVTVWKVQLSNRHGNQGGGIVHESIAEALDAIQFLMESAEETESYDTKITITTGTMSRKALDELGEFKGY